MQFLSVCWERTALRFRSLLLMKGMSSAPMILLKAWEKEFFFASRWKKRLRKCLGTKFSCAFPKSICKKLKNCGSVFSRSRKRSEEHTSELQSQFHLVC